MSSVVERSASGVVYRAAKTLEVPQLDLLTFLFESRWSGADEETVLHAEAASPECTVTKSQLRTLLKRTAYVLRHEYGIGKHGPDRDVVHCLTLGHHMLPNVFFATIAAGGIYTASSPSSTPAEVATQIASVGSQLVVCTRELRPVAVAAAAKAGLPPSRVLVLGAGPGFELIDCSTQRPIPIGEKAWEWERVTDSSTLDDRTICVLFSSGTTGVPKGVRLSHTNMVSAATLVAGPIRTSMQRKDPSFRGRTLAHLPAAHIAGIQGYFVNPFFSGSTVYWMDRFDFARFLEYNRKYAITSFFSVPPIFLLVAKSPLVADHFDSLDHAISGAAPLGKEVQLAAERKLGCGRAVLAQTWGLSETTGSITSMPHGARDATGSVAPLVANCSARIVDDAGRDAKPGETGEIWVRGPVVTKGYFRNEAADRGAFVDGWFCTGDIGYFKDGLFYIVDRKKELIKYKANQVAPAELEALLLTHPQIMDCAVIGVQGEGTEVPRAYVVANKKEVTEQEIVQWVDERVSNPKRLRGGVIFIDGIPKSPAGKILRKILRDAAKKEQVEERPRL